MSAYPNTRPAPFGAIATYRVVDVAERLLGTIFRGIVVWKTRSSLEALNDAQLADIGIARAEIPAIARQVAGA